MKAPSTPNFEMSHDTSSRHMMKLLLGKLVVSGDAFDSATVGDHHATEGPVLPEVLLQQVRAGTCWDAIHGIVRAHDTQRVGLCHTSLKWREVCVHCIPAGSVLLQLTRMRRYSVTQASTGSRYVSTASLQTQSCSMSHELLCDRTSRLTCHQGRQ